VGPISELLGLRQKDFFGSHPLWFFAIKKSGGFFGFIRFQVPAKCAIVILGKKSVLYSTAARKTAKKSPKNGA